MFSSFLVIILCKAVDTPMDGAGMQVPPEYFKTEMESGMPPYELNLKVREYKRMK